MRTVARILLGISTLLLAAGMAGCGGGSGFPISITLSTSPAPTIDQGQVVSVTAVVVNDNANKGVTWSLSGLGSLSNPTSTSVTYVAPPSVTTATKGTVTATSVSNTNATTAVTIQVNPPPTITTTSLPAGTAGTCYGQTSTSSGVACNGEALAETGGTAPYTWGVVSGSLPPGLTLNASAGTVTGTPTTPGTFTFKIALTDAVGLSSSATLSITINDPPALTVSTSSLPTAAINVVYSASLNATGGVAPYVWNLSSGTLPKGLNLSPSGVISGTPTVLGSSSFTVQVTDSEGPAPARASATLSIIVNPMPFSITTSSLPGGTVGIAYGTSLQSSGGVAPITWSVASGTLPAWASLDPSTGLISGTPTAGGTTAFTIQATDSETPTAALATEPLTIAISSTTENVLLSGNYAFSLAGYEGGAVGSFTADGKGNITAGNEDLEDAKTGLSAANVAITSGTYIIGADNRGVLTYTDADGHTFSFDLALSQNSSFPSGSSTGGAMIETDATGDNFTGSFALQAFPTTAITGNYAFGFSGWDANGNSDVLVGSASVSSETVSSGLLDENDAGALTSADSFTGSLSVNASGRGTMTSSVSQANFVFYMVSTSQWYAIAYDTTTGAVRTGIVDEQTGGPYSSGSIAGTMVFETQSSISGPAPQAEAGLLTATGGSSASVTYDLDAGGTLSTGSDKYTLNFTSGANGRFTVTPQSATAMVGYMIAPNQAFIAGAGSTPSFGTLQPQTAGPFTASSLDGSFFIESTPLVSAPPNAQPPTVTSGVIAFDGKVNLTGTLDSTHGGTSNTSTLTDTYSVATNGRVTISPEGAILYIVSPSKIIILSTGLAGSTNPLIEVAQR